MHAISPVLDQRPRLGALWEVRLRFEADTDADSCHAHGESAAGTATALTISCSTAAGVLVCCSFATTGCGRASGALHGDAEIGWDGSEVEGFADESAERDHQVMGVEVSSAYQLLGSLAGKSHLLLVDGVSRWGQSGMARD